MRRFQLVLAFATALSLSACADRTPTAIREPGHADAALARTADGLAPLVTHARDAVPGHYVIMLNMPAAGVGTRTHITAVASQAGVRPHRTYPRLNGFAAALDGRQLLALRRNPRVRLVEQDFIIRAATTQTFTTLSLWGLDRIDEFARPLSGSYTYTNTGSGVNVYVLDTGIQVSHTQFGSRAHASFDAFRLGSDPSFGLDDHGHGTHVAGIIGATKWGVAKEGDLYSVRVLKLLLDGSAGGSLASISGGIEWVIDNHTSPAVANMSFGGDTSTTLDNAVDSLVAQGVFVSVAAGNANVSACTTSPARVASAFTVAASDSMDAKTSFTNHGSCVDAYAPGKYIGSAWFDRNNPTSTTETKALDGTSMAAPFVAGTAALYLDGTPSASPATITTWITGHASENKITGNPTGTPNLLLNKSSL